MRTVKVARRARANLHVKFATTAASAINAAKTFIINAICKFEPKCPPALEPTLPPVIIPPVRASGETQSGIIFIATLEIACCAFCAIFADGFFLAREKIIAPKNKNPTKMIAQIKQISCAQG